MNNKNRALGKIWLLIVGYIILYLYLYFYLVSLYGWIDGLMVLLMAFFAIVLSTDIIGLLLFVFMSFLAASVLSNLNFLYKYNVIFYAFLLLIVLTCVVILGMLYGLLPYNTNTRTYF